MREVNMRCVVAMLGLLLAFGGQAVAQRASSNADAQKAPGVSTGTNAQSDVSAPAGSNQAVPYRDTTGKMSSEEQRAPSLGAGTNADQSKDPTRDPIQSGTHGGPSK
jgi:hypothetical protein